MEKQTRIEILNGFLNNCLNKFVSWESKVNDDSETDCTAYEIKISNSTNDKTTLQILNVYDDGGIQLLRGEDFDDVDEQQFLYWLFLDQFLTYPE